MRLLWRIKDTSEDKKKWNDNLNIKYKIIEIPWGNIVDELQDSTNFLYYNPTKIPCKTQVVVDVGTVVTVLDWWIMKNKFLWK